MTADVAEQAEWQVTACVLCPANCGLEIRVGGEGGRRFERIRGDKANPASQGYTCEKALRLDHYQNHRQRLTSPLRRRADGTFEEIDWDTAISEVAERFGDVIRRYGGESIFYYGGGGQGDHMQAGYAFATMAAMGGRYISNALAQERTGEFWVEDQLFGRRAGPEMDRAEVGIFWGQNPWQSHIIQRARPILKAMSADPGRALVVADPRRTETADLADYHLQLRPGTDAFLLTALLAVIVQDDLADASFLAERTVGAEAVLTPLKAVPVTAYCERSGVSEALVREVAARIAGAQAGVSVFEALGLEQTPHSTLNSYLLRLLPLLTGNFAKPGGMQIHSWLLDITRLFEHGIPLAPITRPTTTPVHGRRVVSGLVACTDIADEILTDHPKRFRAMMVESSNPAHSLAGAARLREAMASLDLLVVTDVAMTETAELAHYVFPAASQFEKWTCTFFNWESPENKIHLRAPILDPLPGTLPESEIHARLCRAMGLLTDDDVLPLREAALRSRAEFTSALFSTLAGNQRLVDLAPILLYETLGAALPDGAAATAAVWALAQCCALELPDAVRRAGFEGEGTELGDALFDAMLTHPSGMTFSISTDEDSWARLSGRGGRIHLAIPELLPELEDLADEPPYVPTAEFPFILSSGERRSGSANTIYRDPAWRKKDHAGALRISPQDAAAIGVADGGQVRLTTKTATVTTVVEITDMMQPGHVSLPNGFGLRYPDSDGKLTTWGIPPNDLTGTDDRDWFAGTPWHKYIPARVELAS